MALPSPPLQTPLVEPPALRLPPSWLITKVWADWLLLFLTRVQTAAVTIITVALTGQAASIGVTALVPLASGMYRVSWHARVTQAATTSSSLTVVVTSTEGAIVCTQSGPALTTNTTNTPQSGSVLVHADPSTPVSYSTTYASVGGTPMQYQLDVKVEQV